MHETPGGAGSGGEQAQIPAGQGRAPGPEASPALSSEETSLTLSSLPPEGFTFLHSGLQTKRRRGEG